MGESESNGVVENNIQIIKHRIRVLKCKLEHHIQDHIPADKDILQWLIQWACTSYNRYRVDKNGFTAYGNIRTRRCMQPVAQYWETCPIQKAPG